MGRITATHVAIVRPTVTMSTHIFISSAEQQYNTGSNKIIQEIIKRWDSEREPFLRRYRTRTSKYQKREPTLFSKLNYKWASTEH